MSCDALCKVDFPPYVKNFEQTKQNKNKDETKTAKTKSTTGVGLKLDPILNFDLWGFNSKGCAQDSTDFFMLNFYPTGQGGGGGGGVVLRPQRRIKFGTHRSIMTLLVQFYITAGFLAFKVPCINSLVPCFCLHIFAVSTERNIDDSQTRLSTIWRWILTTLNCSPQ